MTALVNILSLNVGGSSNLAGLNMSISMMMFDVIFLQEVNSTQCQVDSLVVRHGYSSLVNIDNEDINKPGTALIWKKNFPLIGAVNLVSCRLQMANIGPYKIFNCYAPSGSENRFARNQFYGEEIFRYFKLHSDSVKLLAGDHNSVLKKEDIENGTGFSMKYCEALNTLVKCERLVDCYFLFPHQTQEYTFHRPGKAKSRLDRYSVFQVTFYLLNTCRHYQTILE